MNPDLPAGEITDLLSSWRDGDTQSLDALTPLVYDRLRRLAATLLRHERDDHTLQTTALIHEAFLRLVEQTRVEYRNRQQFFAMAGKMMRRILLDHARARNGLKRGGGQERLPAEALEQLAAPQLEVNLIDLDQALEELESAYPDLVQVVELKFFAGLTIAEAAQVLGAGTATIQRRWQMARAWLHRRLVSPGTPPLAPHHEPPQAS